jgi:hypothetical protein
MIGNQKGLTRAEDISAQNVPLIAGPDDTVVGFDELGGTVYKSKTGEEYTLYPETKTPQERPIVTAAKAVGEYLSDPSLPSLEETSEFAKETIKGAYEPFRKIASGVSPTYGDLSEVLPVGLSGAVTRIGKPLDDTVLSSGGAGPTGYKPKMFSSGEVAVRPGTYSVAEFYSPTVETLRNTEFPSKGYKGSELLKLLQDKTPGIRKAELSAMGLGIDPQKRYNKDEVLGLAEKRSYKVTAEVVDNDINQDTQRQILKDKEVGYSTLKINAIPASEDVQSFLPIRGYTHYDPETIAHTRVSVREGQDGVEYMLVEELQSDLVQHGSVKPRGPITVDDAYEEVLDLLSEDITADPALKSVYEDNQKYFDNLFKVGAENSRQYRLREQKLEVPKADLESYDKLVEDTRGIADQLGDAAYSPGFSKLATMMENAGYEEGYRIDRRTKATGLSPLTEDSDAVRLALQTAMAKASDSDVTSIVIPNVQRIITADRARFGSEAYEKYMKPNSGFQRTYVKGVEKFVKQLQSEYGDRVRISTVELPYIKEKLFSGGEGVDVPKTAIKIDFSDLSDVNLRVGRFAEGGMVEDDQMNKLMQEGGMADDGMSREPVTGNEIPPGSLASEVRDDIDVKLSEGEYVIPADVLRYYGVRFFEDLRAQAKQGMMEMDAEGRIGGTPVDAQGVPMEGQEEELTPEEEQMLVEALGGSEELARTAPARMAYGGMVQQPAPTPYQDQATMYQMPEGMGGPMGMQEGGLTRDGTSTFDRTQFTIPESSGAFESRKYINPTTGEEKTVQFLNGIPMGLVPEGFVPWTPALAEQSQSGTQAPTTQTPSVKPVGVEREGRDRDTAPTTGSTGEGSLGYDRWAEKNSEAITSDPYSFGVNALSDKRGTTVGKGMGIAGALVGGPVGAVIGGLGLGARATSEVQNIAEARAALGVMEAKGLKGTTQYNDLEARIETKIDDLPAGQRVAVRTGVVATGTGYASAALNRTTDAAPSTGLAGKPSGTTSEPKRDTDSSGGVNKVDPGLSKAVKDRAAGQAAVDKALEVGKGIQGNRAADKALADKAAAQTAKEKANKEAVSRAQGDITRRAEGGLISKPEKTSRSKKGLAS